MKFTTTLIILLINFTNIYAKNKYDDSILEVTCLGKYTGVFHSYIYFANNKTSTDYYVIRTPWMLTYPGRIKDALKEKNVYIYDKNPVGKCDWTLRAKIQKAAVDTGYIYEKNNENKELRQLATDILYDLYPSLEIALTVIGSFLAFALCVWIYIMFGCNSGHSNNSYRSYV